ncbi:hypothetical protein DFH09DRAFT_1371378 [Mycena vulgaris]|nr:hypothetical protein DFH09DRAFT_1371378 [Mycena vulgaris]
MPGHPTIAMPSLFLYAAFTLLFLKFSVTLAVAAPDATSALSFAASKWIWASTTTANGLVALRKDFTPPLGKSLIAGEIILTAANFDLYLNGDYVGSATPPSRSALTQRFCFDLLPSYNVFAVNASTAATRDGAFIATILLTYSDFTQDTIVSDSSWRAKNGLPLGFEQLSFDDTAWPVATVAGVYGAAPWGTISIPSDPPVFTLNRAQWVWTNIVPASGSLPVGSRAFRRMFTPAPGQILATANIIISADNAYTLYVNGITVGTGANWMVAQHYIVNFASAPSEIVLAVLVTNTAVSRAGLLVFMEVNMMPAGRANCTAGSFLATDIGWKSTKSAIPTGFEQLGFDDSAWPAVVAEVTYPGAPWNTLTIAAPSAPVTV